MARKTGKFIDKSATVDSSDQIGHLTVPGTEILEVQQERWSSIIGAWFKNIIGFVLLLALFIAILITGLGCTVMTFNAVGDNGERSIILRGAWADTGSKPPIGTKIAVSQTTLAPTSNWWEWATITWTGIPTASTVKVVSTDYDKLYISGDLKKAEITNIATPKVKGTFAPSIEVNLSKYKEGETFEFNHQLKNEYLVECISGSCTKGTYFVINKGQIFGEKR